MYSPALLISVFVLNGRIILQRGFRKTDNWIQSEECDCSPAIDSM